MTTCNVSVCHARYNDGDASETNASGPNGGSSQTSHLELILLPGVALAPDVLLQVHVVFERLSGGREGNRGQKLNHQTTKHTHGNREGEKRKGERREGGETKTEFQLLHPKREEDEKRLVVG